VVAGSTSSFGAGLNDFWVLKLDSKGTVQWQNTYGGPNEDTASSVQQTSDHGYIVAGTTRSFGAGYNDFWVLKLDPTGSIVWQRTYGGGLGDDDLTSIQQTKDGGYIVAGYTNNLGPAGGWDFLVFKLDPAGGVVWQKTYGGTGKDMATTAKQTKDGGYIIGGFSESFGTGKPDFWVVKVNPTGGVVWQKAYGGTGTDQVQSIQQTRDGGYIVAGYTWSFGAGGMDVWILKLNSAGSVVWQKAYGGTGDDIAYSVQQTRDGGYIVAGSTTSFNVGYADVWVLKLNLIGNIQWEMTYGGGADDGAASVQQTRDSGYIVAGSTNSFTSGYQDLWILKLRSDGGTCIPSAKSTATVTSTSATVVTTTGTEFGSAGVVADTSVTPAATAATVLGSCNWVAAYGGPGTSDDIAYSVQQTRDGGYVVAGSTMSYGAVGWDIWVVKLDPNGAIQWENTYGGDGDDEAFSAQQTNDSGYIVAGYTKSFGAVAGDVWVLKLTSKGAIQWQKRYGGSGEDVAKSVQQTRDNGYVVAGYTTSFGAGQRDFWILKLNLSGIPQWQKTYGGSANDEASAVKQTKDSGYIVAGQTWSFGPGAYDIWILKLNAAGVVQWQKTVGGGDWDLATSVQQTSDSGYVVAGYTKSYGAGDYDFWILKFSSTGAVVWQNTYGGSGEDKAYSIQQTKDGGYIVAGHTGSFGGAGGLWLLRLDSIGSIVWQKTYNAASGNSVQQTKDGGYIVAGSFDTFYRWLDFIVLRLDSTGSIPGCGLVSTTATPAPQSVTPTTTSVSGVVTSAKALTTTAILRASKAKVVVHCI
jgi:uncharacterized delta-60 repeat protein